MNMKLFMPLGFAFVLISSAAGLTQPPGSGDSQNAPGGRFGGGRGGDPNQSFSQMTNGKDVWIRSEIQDARMQRRFDFMAGQMGITNGQITRQQYVSFQEQRSAGGGRGPGGPPSDAGRGSRGPGSAPDAGGFGGFRGGGRGNPDSTAEGMFYRLDENGDGVLNPDEMPEELRSERQKWDTDRNGLIDLAEFKAFYEARVQPLLSNRGANRQAPLTLTDSAPAEDERKSQVVYRAGKLPKEMPSWFEQMDTDKDGQVALFEWKASGKSIQEFDEMDRNKDGFLTIDEVLRFVNKGKENAGPEAQQNYAWNGANFGNRFWGRGGGMDRGGRDFGQRGGGRGGMRRGGGGPGFGGPGSGGGPGFGGPGPGSGPDR
jgi:hypothetical protein